MKLHRYIVSLILTGLLFAASARGHAEDVLTGPLEPAIAAVHAQEQQSTDEELSSVLPEAFELVAVDFCYAGSAVDADTGEVIELFVLCTDDAITGNFDLA